MLYIYIHVLASHSLQGQLEDPVSSIRKGDLTMAYQLEDWGPRPPPPADGCHCCEGTGGGGEGDGGSADCGGVGKGVGGSGTKGGRFYDGARGGGGGGVGWEPKLSPFLRTSRRSEVSFCMSRS